jgi:hypothetical protein
MPGIVETWVPLKFRRPSGRQMRNWVVSGAAFGAALTAGVMRLRYAGEEFSHVHLLDADSDLARYDSAAIEIAEKGTWWAVLLVVLALVAAIAGMRRYRVAALGVSIVCAAGAMYLTQQAGDRLERITGPYKPQIALLETFPAPAAWRDYSLGGRASFHPEAHAFWRAGESIEQTCAEVERLMPGWVGAPITTVETLQSNDSCRYEATTDANEVSLRAYKTELPGESGKKTAVVVSLRLVGTVRVQPQDLL